MSKKKKKKKDKKFNKKKEKYASFSKVDKEVPKLSSPDVDSETRIEAEKSYKEAMRYYRPPLDKQEKMKRRQK